MKRNRGYTLIEVLLVVTVIGIAGAVVVPNMLAGGTMGVQAAARIIIADILIAQNEAIATQQSRQVVVDVANNTYRLADDSGTSLSATWRSGGDYVIDFDNDSRFSGVRITAADFGGGSSTLAFDAMGAPASGGTIDIEFGTERYRVTVAQFTGRVTVAKL